MRPKRILIIDDSIVFLKAISMKLRSFGYEVLTAIDGSAGVSTVRRVRPDLILLDLNFPPDVAHGGGVGWNGLMILKWLRRMQEAQSTPVIAITAADLEDCQDACLAAGVLQVFQKPVDVEELVSAIHSALKDQFPDLPPPSPPRKRILFVDDESDWLYMGTLYLQECGYEVFTANDAQGALEQAAKRRPDAIVLDLNLGDGIGLTLMKLLTTGRPNAPILIYTGRELDEAAINDLQEQGAYDCLRKGTMEELLIAVGEAIDATFREDEDMPDESSGVTVESGIESVLIVEDDVEFGDTLRAFLESHPYCVTRVTDGAEALRHVSAVDFDVILCDMVLPSLNGQEFYHAVEKMKPHLCNRFIFMTGHDADPRSDNFIRRAGALMLWKPFHLADLLAATGTLRKNSEPAPPIKIHSI